MILVGGAPSRFTYHTGIGGSAAVAASDERGRGRLGEHALLPRQHGHNAELAFAAHLLVHRQVLALVVGAAVAQQPAPRAYGRVGLAAHGADNARARAECSGAPAPAAGDIDARGAAGSTGASAMTGSAGSAE